MKTQRARRKGKAAPGRSRAREPYLAPRLTFTEISVNEALMGICKGGIGAGPFGPGCGNCMGGGS